MIERICPRCAAGNPNEQAYCGSCGAALNGGAPDRSRAMVRRQTGALARQTQRIPARWRDTGKVVALGVATLLAEAGMAYMQRRQQPPADRPQPLAVVPRQRSRVVAIARRRTELWSNGQLQRRTEEQMVWLAPDES
jgi:hypothetical protein